MYIHNKSNCTKSLKYPIILSLLLSLGIAANCQEFTMRGSLVVTVMTTKGIVIVGDKKLTRITRNESRTDTTYSSIKKIWKLNNSNVYSITGTLQVNFVQDGKIAVFNAQKIVGDFFNQYDKPHLSDALIFYLGRSINDEFSKILFTHESAVREYLKSDKLDVEIIVSGYSQEAKSFQIGGVYFNLKDLVEAQGEVQRMLNGVKRVFEKEYFSISIPIYQGHTDLVRELQSSSNAKFVKLREHKFYKDFIINEDKKLYKPNHAIKFAKWIIEETSKVTPTVSAEVDVAIIDEQGLRWLEDK